MSSNYYVYPVYGRVDGRVVLGCSKDIADIRQFRRDARYHAVNCNSRNSIVIDWKRYKLKWYMDGIETTWRTFKADDFWKMFRFTTPCEDWEIHAYGRIR